MMLRIFVRDSMEFNVRPPDGDPGASIDKGFYNSPSKERYLICFNQRSSSVRLDAPWSRL